LPKAWFFEPERESDTSMLSPQINSYEKYSWTIKAAREYDKKVWSFCEKVSSRQRLYSDCELETSRRTQLIVATPSFYRWIYWFRQKSSNIRNSAFTFLILKPIFVNLLRNQIHSFQYQIYIYHFDIKYTHHYNIKIWYCNDVYIWYRNDMYIWYWNECIWFLVLYWRFNSAYLFNRK